METPISKTITLPEINTIVERSSFTIKICECPGNFSTSHVQKELILTLMGTIEKIWTVNSWNKQILETTNAQEAITTYNNL